MDKSDEMVEVKLTTVRRFSMKDYWTWARVTMNMMNQGRKMLAQRENKPFHPVTIEDFKKLLDTGLLTLSDVTESTTVKSIYELTKKEGGNERSATIDQ